MDQKKLTLLVCALGVVAPAHGQDIEYEKYQLDSGMTVILHENHTLPVACVNIWYRVGAKDEPAGRSGFAHLFEHLMFMGTHRVPEGAFDEIMEGGGGANNASTGWDRTNYFASGPSNLLPTLLWLEADRLEDLGNAMTAEKLDKQREVVRNERRQSYENRPYGKALLKISEIMYPAGHPYHDPVIGSHEDLQAASVENVKDFFATYYVPSNASLVVAGDFDPAGIKPLIATLFGTLPARPGPRHATSESAPLAGVQRLTMSDKVQFARTSVVYHSPAFFAPGDADMDLLAAVLTSGKSSRLYKRLVYDDKTAVDVEAFQGSSQLGSLFHIEATARPGIELATLEKSIDEEIARLLSEGISTEELGRHKAAIETSTLAGLQRIQAVADRLNLYEYYFGEPNSFARDLDRYRQATPESVRTQAAEVLTPEARLILRVVPETPEAAASARDSRPEPGEPGAFVPGEPEKLTLGNGLEVQFWRRSELPLVAVRLLLRGGSAADGAARAGLASLTAEMLDEGTGELDALAFSDAMEALGASFNASADYEGCGISLFVLKRNFQKALSLYAEAVQRPSFLPKEWDRVKTLHLQKLRQAQDDPRSVAQLVAARAYFGDDHPYGRPAEGLIETVTMLTVDDLKRFHAALFRPERAVLLVAGDLTRDELMSSLEETFGRWRASEHVPPVTPPVFPPVGRDGLRTYLVHRPGAVQTVVQLILPAPPFRDPARVKLRLLNTIFGGSFTSRLNQNLREQHGYTYGARSSFAMDPSVGYCVVGTSVQTEVTGAALGECLKEFERIRGGDVTPDEAAKARATVRNRVVESFAGLQGILSTAATLTLNGMPFSTVGRELAEASAISHTDLNAIARGALPLEEGVLLLVGDRTEVLEQLRALNLTIDGELTVTGEPVAAVE